MSALYRMTFSEHERTKVNLGKDDLVVISATPIPGNEKLVSGIINELLRKGVEVVYNQVADVHVSGHACQEEIKLLILISDGQPADTGYHGTIAEEDLRGIKQEYRRKGVLFVAAAIGNDKENIERIYGDSFMDITDLSELPAKLTSVVKRHIRV
jgi:hypothetical protein